MTKEEKIPVDPYTLVAKILAKEFLKRGTQTLSKAVLGAPDARSLEKAVDYAFHYMRDKILKDVGPELSEHVVEVISGSIVNDATRRTIVELVLTGGPSVADSLSAILTRDAIDKDTLPIPFEELTRHFLDGLSMGLEIEAERPDSAIFNLYILKRIRSIETFARALHEQSQLNLSLPLTDFGSVSTLFERIDKQVIRAVRDNNYLTNDEVRSIYRALLDHNLQHSDTSLVQVLDYVRGSTTRDSLVSTVPKPTLSVIADIRLESVEYKADSTSLKLANPKLLWNCTCDGSAQSCPIHSEKTAKSIASSFVSGFVDFRIEHQSYIWRNSDALFPPAVDALHMIDVLRRDNILNSNVSSILDVGCGTGFLGLHAYLDAPQTTRLAFTDWLLTPILYTAVNYGRSGIERQRPGILDIHIGLNSESDGELLNQGPFDLAICNPPYLPIRQGYEELALRTSTAGTELLCDVITNKLRIARRTFVSFSELAKDEANDMANRVGLDLVAVGDPLEVPFRNPYASDYPGYLDELLVEGTLFTKPGDSRRHWHRIQVYEIK